MTFQASDFKGKQFLDLLDNDNNIIEPSYIKGRLAQNVWPFKFLIYTYYKSDHESCSYR